jgi:hypothetical protein
MSKRLTASCLPILLGLAFVPARADEIKWVRDYATGMKLARETKRAGIAGAQDERHKGS